MRALAAALAAGLAAGLLAGCGQDGADGTPAPAAASPSGGEVVVLAAASLTETFTELAERYERETGTTVTVSFGASSALAQQLLSGAPADVFASAAPGPVEQVAEGGLVEGEPTVFARNVLQIAVPAGNPAGVTGLADLADPERLVALCAEQVPCGSAAVRAFEAAGLTPAPDTYEQDVRGVLTKVELGEVDAGLVYRTDVRAAGDAVEGIAFPEAAQAVNDYPVALLSDADPAAAGFVDLVLSAEGQEVLGAAGFDPAP